MQHKLAVLAAWHCLPRLWQWWVLHLTHAMLADISDGVLCSEAQYIVLPGKALAAAHMVAAKAPTNASWATAPSRDSG